ncbi:NUDIX hydrolase [Spironucleus salmonicida]|uniref:NUDIX hydrolase n=1 Tax=Spironucleus salmonicida TaxID=348837 RepID=V6LYL7_9EUKA|nr:NUDIX hydrolase [Spironucleus salmonicida]|eukprot:EST48816.1 NUDIX hydrolase [Spironucleus salmonicida]
MTINPNHLTYLLLTFPDVQQATLLEQGSQLLKLTFLLVDNYPDHYGNRDIFVLREAICKMLKISCKCIIFYPTRAVAALIVNPQRTNFLACRYYKNLGLPKGGIEGNEPCHEACSREVFEETGLQIEFTNAPWEQFDLGDQIVIVFMSVVNHLKMESLKPLSDEEIHGYSLVKISRMNTLTKKWQKIAQQLQTLAQLRRQPTDLILQQFSE